MSDDLFYDENELQASAFGRVIVTGPRKMGKTTALLTTAPGPIAVLNCDGEGAPIAAKRFGAKDLKIVDVTSPDLWRKAVDGAIKLADKGEVRSIVVDTFTLLVNNVLTLAHNKRYEGFEIWRNVLDDGIRGLTKLSYAQAHVFIVCHHNLEDGQLLLNGALKEQVPSMMHDIVQFEFRAAKEPRRVFHIGPDAAGMTGSRLCDENKTIPANAEQLLCELGYNV
jgi:hypothetical protein